MAEPITVLQYIGTAVTVAKFLTSERLQVTVDTIGEWFRRRGETPPAELASTQGVALINLMVIHPDLLDDLTKEAQEGIARYRSCLKRATSRGQRAACDRKAEHDVCDTLSRIRERNNGQLPTDFLKNQWSAFGCA